MLMLRARETMRSAKRGRRWYRWRISYDSGTEFGGNQYPFEWLFLGLDVMIKKPQIALYFLNLLS